MAEKGGLLSKLLLPGFHDAGANTNFQASPKEEQQQQMNVSAVPSFNRLVFRPIISDEDAMTEIADNRTSTSMQHEQLPNQRMEEALASQVAASTPTPTTPAPRDDSKFPQHGFFPSTTPNRRQEHGSSSPRRLSYSPQLQPQPQPPQPNPPSPPTVARRQLPLPTSATKTKTNAASITNINVAGMSVVPQISADQQSEAATTATTASSVLGYQFLKDPPTTSNTSSKDEQNDEVDRRGDHEEHARTSTNDDQPPTNDDQPPANDDQPPTNDAQPPNPRQQQQQDENANDCSADDSLSTSSNSNNSQEHHLRNSSLLEYGNNYSPTNQSDVHSDDMNSNASEFGTVINLNGARLEEVEAMAALIEATPSCFDEQLQHAYGEADDDPSGLALPRLESHTSTQNQFYRPPHRSSEPPRSNLLPAKHTHTPTSLHEMSRMEGTGNYNNKGSPLVMDKGASAMVSAAIRRIGSGLHKKKATQQTLSAPPTPGTPGVPSTPRVEDLLKISTLSPKRDYHTHPPPSFALRSPGSAARRSLMPPSSSPRRLLTPRFSRPLKTRNDEPPTGQRLTPRTDNQSHKQPQLLRPQPQPPQSSPLHGSSMFPFRFAQKCFSFDSTLDNHLDSDYPSSDRHHELPVRQRHHEVPVRQSSRQTFQGQGIGHTQSWDVGSVSNQNQRQPFRNVRTKPVNDDPVRRERLHSDFSPSKASQHSIELQTPQRIEIEREDALDILACLVERGVSMDKATSNTTAPSMNAAPTSPSSDEQKTKGSAEQPDFTLQVQSVVEELKRMSQKQHQIGGQDHRNHDHNQRMSALDELLRSHAYALEMKRAAISASTWLKSIGRSVGRADDPGGVVDPESNSSGGQASAEQGDTSTASEKIELMTLKAQLHTAQMEAKEKTEAAQKMDLELSKCRAEIGRLRSSSSRAEYQMPMTPNRSIMDDSLDTEIVSPGADVANTIDRKNNNPSPIEKEGSLVHTDAELSSGMNDSLFRGLSEAENKDAFKEQADHVDVLVMRTALDQANAQIRHMHHALTQGAPESGPPPIVDIPDLFEGQDFPSDENRMVNVRMLDGENFVTEWDNLTPPLPPPPDHGLRSPIVGAVLEQWTSDRALHESLVAWIERVMSGNDIEAVPPLTISSLDHQVRDGFTMHLLPLLLRRADIHVTVQTRAHRRTTYDLAVTVNRKSQHIAYTESPCGMMDGDVHDPRVDDWSNRLGPGSDRQSSVAHSAVTAHINNAVRQSPTHYDNHTTDDMGNYAEDNFGGGLAISSSYDMSEALQLQQQQGLMTALGGALGGLLSRRKCSVSSPSRFHDTGSGMPAALRAQLDLTSSPIPSASFRGEEDEQPYHRVVSAPPGRIGITFVEYRGHCYCSDVSPSSPLLDWVFPSDILIAIDEIPVSGMRVRDIIKVLTNRKDRQRALRVISSHAMNEFTLNASHMNDTS